MLITTVGLVCQHVLNLHQYNSILSLMKLVNRVSGHAPICLNLKSHRIFAFLNALTIQWYSFTTVSTDHVRPHAPKDFSLTLLASYAQRSVHQPPKHSHTNPITHVYRVVPMDTLQTTAPENAYRHVHLQLWPMLMTLQTNVSKNAH